MLARDTVEEFLDLKFKERDMEVPRDVNKRELVETFCKYVEGTIIMNG